MQVSGIAVAQPQSPPIVAIVGYGRFGRALANLFVDAGYVVRAHDSNVSIPVTLATSSLESLVHGATHVVLAVPTGAMRSVLEEIVLFLDESHLVIDVGSVKIAPCQAFVEVLGARVPWVGTHPLFGPMSLSLAEKPLRVVVCPNSLHPEAARRAGALYGAIGCEVLEESPEAHDRRMAETHVLAFFLAKGILEAQLGIDVPYAPPSFQAITRMVGAVRADAGHLFAAIQRENPFAAETRRKFIQALEAIDARLVEPGPAPTNPRPKTPESTFASASALAPDLRQTREYIDDLDRELLGLLVRRMELARRARRVKTQLGMGIVDRQREAEVLENRRRWAISERLEPDCVAAIFEAILRLSRFVQQNDE
ncbi:MAG TPA: prephenate dehydrogenase/arogenate dehydrogenase family protein [Polyangium sp.]|nr:prephenate dehydrogenase/arogenate dehydrogenase family protein [Polyangium sp.]